jgi:hypothetical protein
MKTILRILAVALLLIAAVTWGLTGTNRGWTKTSLPVKTVDEVTGIEGITYRDGFFPGIDFLGGAALGAATLAGISFFIGKRKQTKR